MFLSLLKVKMLKINTNSVIIWSLLSRIIHILFAIKINSQKSQMHNKIVTVQNVTYLVEMLLIFILFQCICKKVFSLLRTITVKPLMSHGLFYRCSCYVSARWSCKDPCCMEGQIALRVHQKYLNLCFEDEQRSYGFRMTWGWVIFGWTNPLIYAFG